MYVFMSKEFNILRILERCIVYLFLKRINFDNIKDYLCALIVCNTIDFKTSHLFNTLNILHTIFKNRLKHRDLH